MADLLGHITARELSEWMAFDRLSPIGGERADVQAASICKTLADVNRGKRAPFKLTDFLLRYGANQKMSTKQMKQTWQAIKHALSKRNG